MSNLVSIIMPAYNASSFIADAIRSVINQEYENWELLIINDGSTDQTKDVIFSFQDNRIKYLEQSNKGVSSARNFALGNMKGDFFCFLDADDVLPSQSIKARLNVFDTEKDVAFVDGTVEIRNQNFSEIIREYKPTYKGYPLKELVHLKETCFFGPTWMIRNNRNTNYRMKEGLTHGEDLLFYMEIAGQGLYSHTSECVLYYRKSSGSAMSNLDGLFEGYKTIWQEIRKKKWASKKELFLLRIKIGRIIVLSYWKENEIIKGLRVVMNLMWLR